MGNMSTRGDKVNPSAWNSLPKVLRAVTDPGLFRKTTRDTFLVFGSVFSDDTDDSVMHLCVSPMLAQ